MSALASSLLDSIPVCNAGLCVNKMFGLLFCYFAASFSDAIPVRNAGFGEGSISILLDNLRCMGDEGSLLGCVDSADIGTHDCDHSEDAGVRCEGMAFSVIYYRDVAKYENKVRMYTLYNTLHNCTVT